MGTADPYLGLPKTQPDRKAGKNGLKEPGPTTATSARRRRGGRSSINRGNVDHLQRNLNN